MKQRVLSTVAYARDRGFFDLLSVNFLTQFLGFGSVLLVAKFLTPIELGEVRILQSYLGLFSVFAGFGINAAVLKTCAGNRPSYETSGILRFALGRVSITISVTMIAVIVLSRSGLIVSSRDLSYWLMIYSCIVPLDVITGIFVVFLQAQKKIRMMARSQAIVKLQAVPLIVASTWLWGFRGFVFASIIGYLLGLWPFLRQIGFEFIRTSLDEKPEGFMSYALFSFLANSVSVLGQRGDIFILDRFSTNREAIGYYSLALVFIMGASQVTGTVQSITLPYFTQRAHDKTWFRNQLKTNQIRIQLLSVVVAFGVFVGAWVLVPQFYGQSYSPTLTYLVVLLVKYVVWSSYALLATAMFSLGYIQYNAIIVFVSTPIGLFATYFFLAEFGVMGVAWAQVLSSVVALCLAIIFTIVVFRQAFGEIDQ